MTLPVRQLAMVQKKNRPRTVGYARVKGTLSSKKQKKAVPAAVRQVQACPPNWARLGEKRVSIWQLRP